MKTDVQLANEAVKLPITHIANKININEEHIELYGKDKAKINFTNINDNETDKNLIYVTAISPNRAGVGKSTTTVGLVDSLALINKNVIGCLREPSMGPVFGLKGGATGGGFAQVNPMEDINLHFTGDMHAITSANNLICAVIDNFIHQGNELEIDKDKIFFKRVIDMNDRVLREIEIGLGSVVNGIERKDSFQITVASEIMAILCLSSDLEDFKTRVDKIIFAKNIKGEDLYVSQLNITDAVAIIMKEAIKPNLAQTLENNPILIHGGPFANIAHGCSSIISTKLALKVSDYVVTEGGFGSDLGYEKLIDIKSTIGKLKPNVTVIVATIKALKLHGGVSENNLEEENLEALKKGLENLKRHCSIVNKSNVPFVIAINKFSSDTSLELDCIQDFADSNNYNLEIIDVWLKGGNGGINLANKVVELCKEKRPYKTFYDINDDIEDKINKLVKNVYGGIGFELSDEAKEKIKSIRNSDYNKLPICVAKTPSSFSDDPKLVGAPDNFVIKINNLEIRSGAGFIIVYTGKVLTMPGLPKVPNANNMKYDGKTISGLI